MLGVFGGVLAAVLLLVFVLPFTYTAQATLGPSSSSGYGGPTPHLIASVTSSEVLKQVASQSGLNASLGLDGLLGGLDPDPAERLRVAIVPYPETGPVHRLTVEASGRTENGALEAVSSLAARLMAVDRAVRSMTRSQRERGELPTKASGKPARLQLEELRERHPMLRDSTVVARYQRNESVFAEEEIALGALRIQYAGAVEAAERLETQVNEEASRAYAADLDERSRRARELETAQANVPSERPLVAPPRRVVEGPAQRSAPSPSESLQRDSLERQLQKLLAVYTRQHPNVRKLLRTIKLTEESQAPVQTEEPAPPAEEDTQEPETKPVRFDPSDDGSVIPIADQEDPPAQPGAPPPTPKHWIQRAPSYMLWVNAKNRVGETKVTLDSRTQVQQARTQAHKKLAKRLEGLGAARLEEQRLLAHVQEEEQTPASGEAPSLYEPLILGKQATIMSIDSPWRLFPGGLGLAVLLGLIAGWVGDQYDRSFFAAKEVTQKTQLPVLGVIPHLRAR